MSLANIIVRFALAGSVVLLTACGSEESPAPDGSSITLNPSSTEWATGADPTCTYELLTVPVDITVRDANYVPLNGIDLTLSMDLAAGTTSNPNWEVLELYDNTVKVAFPYRTKTDGSGTKTVTVGMWIGCNLSYRAYLHVYSGSAYNSAEFQVKAQ